MYMLTFMIYNAPYIKTQATIRYTVSCIIQCICSPIWYEICPKLNDRLYMLTYIYDACALYTHAWTCTEGLNTRSQDTASTDSMLWTFWNWAKDSPQASRKSFVALGWPSYSSRDIHICQVEIKTSKRSCKMPSGALQLPRLKCWSRQMRWFASLAKTSSLGGSWCM